MKALFVCLLTLLLYLPLHSQQLDWVFSTGGTSHSYLRDIVVDENQHTFATGYFLGTCDFDPSANTQSYISNGNSDVFIARYDETGALVWARTFGGSSTDNAFGVVQDTQHNLYIVGSFSTSVDFDPGPSSTLITSAGSYDIFLSKFDEQGNFLWARTIGGVSLDWGGAITIDAADNLYITGRYNQTVDFDPGPGTNNLQSYGQTDTYIAKFTPNGNHLWAHHMGSTGSEMGYGITTDDSANVFICGYFHDHANFIPGSLTTQLTAFNKDIFLVKYDSSGRYRWVNGMGGPGTNCEAQTVDCDSQGNVVVSGLFWGGMDLDPSASTASHTPVGGSDIWVAKYDLSGNYIWSEGIGGVDNEFPLKLKLDPQEDIVLTGHFYGTTDFDPGPGVHAHTALSGGDVFLAKYTPNGNYLWSETPSGNGNSELGSCLAFDDSSGIYIGGNFSDTLYFQQDTLMGSPFSEIFLARYQDSLPISTGIYAQENERINVYPNPGKDQLRIQLPQSRNSARVRFLDLNGHVLMDQTYAPNSELILNLPPIAKGLYLLTVESGGKLYRKRYRVQ